MIKTRIITALILVTGFLLACFAFSSQFWAIFTSIIVLLAAKEWCFLLKVSKTKASVFQCVTVSSVLLFGFFSSSFDNNKTLIVAAIYAGSLSIWLLSIPAFLRFNLPVKAGYIGYLFGFWSFFSAAVAMQELREMGVWILLAAMAPVWLADIAAFFSGRQFGHRKLAPTISPGKTWEGVAGAVCAVVIYAFVVRNFIPTTAQPSVMITLLIALIYTAMSVEGDLFESMVKRQSGVKDSGNLLPGHGGILDRIDSLLPTLPFAAALVLWFR